MTSPDALASPDPDDLRLVQDDPLSLDQRDDLPTFVPTLPPTTFVQVVRALREESRLDLVLPHATPEQLTALLDLDGWQRDRVALDRARAWLLAIAETYVGADLPRGALTRTIEGMDPEMWTMALLPGTSVYLLDPDDTEQRDEALAAVDALFSYETPDGNFIVAVPDNPLGHAVIQVLERVYMDDLQTGRELALSLRGALPGPLEEELLRWRQGRLADLGFVEWEEAMKLFRPLDLKSAREATAPTRAAAGAPTLAPTLSLRADLLRRALAAVGGGEQGVRAREFALLVNELMSAQRFEPGDRKLQERAFHQAEATVNLGLELLASGLAADAALDLYLADRVAALGLRGLFRVGYGPLATLRKATLALHREGRVSLTRIGSLLDRPWGPALEALSPWYPELPVEATSGAVRPIAGLRDVARATELVAQSAALADLAFHPQGYAIDPAWVGRVDEPERLTLGDLVRTAALRIHLSGGAGGFAPLDADDLERAREHLLQDGRLAPAIVTDLRARCLAIGAAQHAEAFAQVLLGRLEVELAGLELGPDGAPDLTRVAGVLTVQRVSVWLKTGLVARA